MKIFLGILAGLIIFFGSIALFIWSAYSTAGKKENGIIAVYEDMQNVYANSIIEVLEQKGIVVEKYKSDVIETINANMLRYKNDKNLLFKAVAESAGLTVSPELYKDMSRSIESGYRSFENKQRDKIDRVRNYKDFINYSIRGKIAGLFGFPSEKAKFVMELLILNDKTNETFTSGKMVRPELFKK